VLGVLAAAPSPRVARADEPPPRRDAQWQQAVAEAKDALAHGRLEEARDRGFDAQRLGDLPDTSAILASALFGIALVGDDRAGVSHATLMAEKCLQQLGEPDPDLDGARRDAIRLTCLSIAARAYRRIGDNPMAHARAEECAAMRVANAPLVHAQSLCRRVLDETEDEGYGALGGTWWKYLVVTGHAGYAFRYYSVSRLSSPGGRLDGFTFEAALGYPSFHLGPVLLRPEAFFRWEGLSDQVSRFAPNELGTSNVVSSEARVLDIGGRFVLTFPTRMGTLETAIGASAAQLAAHPGNGSSGLFLADDRAQITEYASSDWSCELEALLRWGTPELRVRGFSFVFAVYAQLAYVLSWHLTDPTGVEPARDISSLSVRWGIALRFRFGELKPY
jgi:hypothetical protein